MNLRQILRWIKDVLVNLYLGIAFFIAVFPVLWIVLSSFKDPKLVFSLPPVLFFKPTLQSYHQLLTRIDIDFAGYFINSIITGVMSTLISVIAATLCAYALTRFQFRGKRIITLSILVTRMLPPIAATIPLFLLALKFNLLDTKLSLILAYTAMNIPINVLLLRGFIEEVPWELEESAMLDGCNKLSSLIRIVLPVIAPGLATTSVLSFIQSWNEFPLALMLTSKSARTVPLISMLFITEEGINWGQLSAAVTLIIMPPVFVILFMQKNIASGLTMGAVKG